jgi:lysophospholipase L1-like esterase
MSGLGPLVSAIAVAGLVGMLHADSFRVLTVGNSITANCGFPEKLDVLLGDSISVYNAGAGGTTALRSSGTPYWVEAQFREVFAQKPDIITIKFGTNDCRTSAWDRDTFAADLVAMIDTFGTIATRPIVWLCCPVPFSGYRIVWEDSIVKAVIPAVQKAAAQRDVKIIDLHSPLVDHPELFPDGAHPSPEGADSIAAIIDRTFRSTPMVRLSAYRVDFPEGQFGDRAIIAANPLRDSVLAGVREEHKSGWLTITIDSTDRNRRVLTHHIDTTHLQGNAVLSDTVTITTANDYPKQIRYPVVIRGELRSRNDRLAPDGRRVVLAVSPDHDGTMIIDFRTFAPGRAEVVDARGSVVAVIPVDGNKRAAVPGLSPGFYFVRVDQCAGKAFMRR